MLMLVLFLAIGFCHAEITNTEDGTVLFGGVTKQTRFGGVARPSFRSQTVHVISEFELEELCELNTAEQWRRKSLGVDVLFINSSNPFDVSCDGKWRWFSGEFQKYWCALSKAIVIFSPRIKQSRVVLPNMRFEELLADDCSILIARYNHSMIDYVASQSSRMRINIDLDIDQWEEFMDSDIIKIMVQLGFPAVYVFIVYKGTTYLMRRHALGKLRREYILIYMLDCPLVLGLVTLNIMGCSHYLLFADVNAAMTIFMFPEFFGASIAADIVLAMKYRAVVLRLTGNISDKRIIPWSGEILIILLAILDITIMALNSFALSGKSIQIFVTIMWPAFLSLVQMVTISFALMKANSMRTFLKRTSNEYDADSATSGLSGAKLASALHRLEMHVRVCMLLSSIASAGNIVCTTLFAFKIGFYSPELYVAMITVFKMSRVLNTWARMYSIKVVSEGGKSQKGGFTMKMRPNSHRLSRTSESSVTPSNVVS